MDANGKQNDDSELEIAENQTNAKKQSAAFSATYAEKWSFMQAGEKGPEYAYCTICETDVSIRYAGADDCEWHSKRG